MKIHHKHLATAACLIAGLHLTMCHGMEVAQDDKDMTLMQQRMHELDLGAKSPFFANYNRMKMNVEGKDFETLQQNFLNRVYMLEGNTALSLKDAEKKYCEPETANPVTTLDKMLDVMLDVWILNYDKVPRKYQIGWERRILNEDMKKEKIALLELYEATHDHIRTAIQEQRLLTTDDPIHTRFSKAVEQLPHIKIGDPDTDEPNTLCHWYKHRNELHDFITYFSSEQLKQEIADNKELMGLFMGDYTLATISRMFILYDAYQSFLKMKPEEHDLRSFMINTYGDRKDEWPFKMASALLAPADPFDLMATQSQLNTNEEEVAALRKKINRIEDLLAQKGYTHTEFCARMKLQYPKKN